MLEVQKRSVEGRECAVTTIPARKALSIQARLFRLFGPAIGMLLGRGGDGLGDLPGAIQTLALAANPAEFEALVLDLLRLSAVTLDEQDLSKDEAFNAAFTGNVLMLYKILGFVLEVNFGSFFGKGGIEKLAARFAPTGKPESAPQPPNA